MHHLRLLSSMRVQAAPMLRPVASSSGIRALMPAQRAAAVPTPCLAAPARHFSAAATKKSNDATATFRVQDFQGHLLDDMPSVEVETTKSELMGFYREMSYFRRIEIASDNLYKKREIRGFCHLYDGQEAIPAGMEAGLTKEDSIITAYREHCQQIARGDTGEAVMAEQLGKATGCSKGKGGSMHMYLPSANFYGGNGIVGAQVPVGAGVAFAHKYKGQKNICVAMFGDGAANQGQVYEAANIAKLWDLPLVFCCENNEYGMGTSKERSSASFEYYKRGGYVPGLWIDGMDVLAVKRGFEWAKQYCIKNGPLFIEVQTYRYHGHSMSDPGVSYRDREEVAKVRSERDCILNVKNRLLELEWATADELKAIDKEVRKQADTDVKNAKAAPQPDLKELYTDVYVPSDTSPTPFIRGVSLERRPGM